MKNEVKHYLSVYKEFFATSYSVSTSFRTSFVLIVLMDIFFYISTLWSIDMIYGHLGHIGPWNREQLLFFISFMLCLDQLHMVLVSENFWELSEKIKTGNVDFILMKPISSIFISFFRDVRISSMVNGPIVWSLLIYFGIQVKLPILSWFLLPIIMLLAFSILIFIEFILSTLMLWSVAGIGINFLRMQFQSMSRWPEFIYSPWSRRLLTFVFPILMIGSPSIRFLINPKLWHLPIFMLITAASLFLILNNFWNLALRKYESASS